MSEALKTLRKKLDFLQAEEAKVSDAEQKFSLSERIGETKGKIAELEAATARQPAAATAVLKSDIDINDSQLTPERRIEIQYHCRECFENSALTTHELFVKEAETALEPILKRRGFDLAQSCADIQILLRRFEKEGDLRHAGRKAHAKVLYWAARLHATQDKKLTETITYRDILKKLDPSKDVRIIDAWIQAAQGDVEEALRIVRDIDNPDGRSNLLALLLRNRSSDDVLAWLMAQSGRSDPAFLTGAGWFNVAIAYAISGQLQEAISCLAAAKSHVEKYPALVCQQGVLNAAMLLPEPLRQEALQIPPYLMDAKTSEGEDADRYRTQALECFATAAQYLEPLGLSKQLQQGNLMQLWLRLTDSRSPIRDAARLEVVEGARDCAQAALLLPIIYRFDIPFNPDPVRQYLELRKRLGGLEPAEIIAEFTLALMTLQPGELANLLEQEGKRFATVFSPYFLTGLHIEALAKDKQFSRAKDLLEERKSDFLEPKMESLRILVDVHAGVDVRERAEKLYEASGNNFHYLNELIDILWKQGDWPALLHRLEELFHFERNLKNALRLVQCLERMPSRDDQAIVTFLVKNQDLVTRDHNLSSSLAWSLFCLGRWQEADAIVGCLLLERRAASDLFLETNLALQTGNWERFAVIVDRECQKLEEHKAATLLHLAGLAAEADISKNRAITLARLAVEKAPDNPNVLVNAWSLAVQVGQEKEVDIDWMVRAAKESSETGPVLPVSLRMLAEEIMPARREHSRKVEEALTRGEIILHFAVSALNLRLSNILLDLPRRNTATLDGRERAVIPVFSGVRNPIPINPEWTVGFDVTSLLVLFHLDLLEPAMRMVKRVALAPDTMLFLLNERRRARFHQPSRVKKAEEVLSLIGHSLRIAESLPEPPGWLIEEVGLDLSQFLEAARTTNGRVVHPVAIFKQRSFHEEKAAIREYASLPLSTVAFTRLLHDSGLIDSASYDRALGYLRIHDQDQDGEADIEILDRPLFLDELALTYLQEAGLLPSLARAGIDLRVHPSLKSHQEGLVEANRHGERQAEELDKLRCLLRDTLDSGKAFFLPLHRPSNTEETEELWLNAPAVMTFLKDAAPCDAVCIDDRCFNHNPILADEKGYQATVLCTLDFLDSLEGNSHITAAEKLEKLHRLREGCFGLVPVSAQELERRLSIVRFDNHGQMVESPELRSIRQTLMRIRSLDMLQPSETSYLVKLRLECMQVLSRLWKDEAISLERKLALSDWVWRHVVPSPLDWCKSFKEQSDLQPLAATFGNHLAMLLSVGMIAKESHRDAFLAWVEDTVIAPLLPANSKLLDGCLPLLKNSARMGLKNITSPLKKALLAECFCNYQPRSICWLLQRDEAFCREMGLTMTRVITAGDLVHISEGRLFKAARRLLDTRSEQELSDTEGRRFKLGIEKNTVVLKDLPGREASWSSDFPELLLLSPRQDERLLAVERTLQDLGPATPDFTAEKAAAAERELSVEEVTSLLTESLSGVAATQGKAESAFAEKEAGLFDLVPQDLTYYEKFCGPNPADELPVVYLRTRLPDYRKLLLSRDLTAGLDICLLGALRDDLCPGAWIEHESHDAVWSALQECELATNPFSLLGALDIALLRQEDERFRNLADDLMGKLLQDLSPRPDGIDSYRMLALLAELALNSLDTLKDGPIRQPFWKRMSAWMHAGTLLRITSQYRVDLPLFENWADSQLTFAGEYAKIIDLRREPMYIASTMSAKSLQQEVLGRLSVLRSRHKAQGRMVPRGSELDSIIADSNRGKLHWWGFPGPLEGHQRPEIMGGRTIPEAEAAELVDKLGKDPGGPLFSALAQLSQHFDLRGPLLNHAREVAGNTFSLGATADNEACLAGWPMVASPP